LFDVKKKGVKISANNLEMGIEFGIASNVTKEGTVLVPAKTSSGIVSKLPDADVSFKLNEKGTIKISFNQSNFNVHTLPPDEFPALAKVKDGKSFLINSVIFSSMIKQTIFSVSSSEDKHVLSGVLLEFGKSSRSGDSSNFRMVSTDGYRLAKRGESLDLKADVKGAVIVPAKALQEIARIIDLEKGEGPIEITFANDQISFKYNEVYLVSRVIQGQFPDYRQVLPKKSATKIEINRKLLLASSERAAVIAAGSANIVRFDVRDDKLRLFASTPDVGTVDEVLDAKITGQGTAQIAFNIRLITDVLKVLEGENIIIELSEALGPGLIQGEGEANYFYIVMPIKTQETS
ncbi:MAG: DNA polymerase III subunit beta, partial [Candidatus Margulisbacteria bacterium]|nr:DNA polymerase III subunit beta [Candidatus Margulisiibacteriota bacterium]